MRINYNKHFKEGEYEDVIKVPYKTKRYLKKLELRDKFAHLNVKDFLESDEY